jgi:hypothetical protein
MRDVAYRLIPGLAVALALSACNTIDHQHGSAGEGSGIPQSEQPVTNTFPSSEKGKPAHIVTPEDERLVVNLHVFGLSYHPDRAGTRISHLDNELNFGLGLGYKLYEDELGVVVSEAGFFKDSGRNWAKFAGVGYGFKLTDGWRLGADLLAVHSPTYNYGSAFVAPIPRLSYDFSRVKVNLVYLPRYKEFNRFAVYGLYFTIPIWK